MGKIKSYIKVFFLLGVISAQNALMAQVNFDVISQKFDTYRRNSFTEKLYVHMDRPAYLTGETLWLKIYCVDGTFHQPQAVSRVAYVELLNADGQSVIQAKVKLSQQGTGDASIAIPVSLSSGNYVFRAYTNWMKNFKPDFFYTQEVQLINAFVPLDTAKSESPRYDIQFFPEGGDLIAGIESRVAFRGVDQHGKGLEFEGAIIESQDTVVRFSPTRFGFGSFRFQPERDKIYRAQVRHQDGTIANYNFPAIKPSGYALQVSDNSLDIELSIRHNFDNSGQYGNHVNVFIHTRNEIDTVLNVDLAGNQAKLLVPKVKLRDGISHITVFDSNLRPVCERLYYKEPVEKLVISAEVNGSQATRSRVSVGIQTSNVARQTVDAGLSIAVYRIDSLGNSRGDNIDTYLWATSDLVGRIENPEYYFGNQAQASSVEIDDLVLTHGWRRFSWTEVLGTEPAAKRQHVAEINGHIIHGRLLDSLTKQPIGNEYVFLSVPTTTRFNLSLSSNQGQFFAEVDFYGTQPIVTQSMKSSTFVELESPFATQQIEEMTLGEFSIGSEKAQSLNLRSVHMQVSNAYYRHPDTTGINRPPIYSFYGNYDRKYLLDDYTRFPTMEEVLREYVPEVAVRKNRGSYKLLVMNPNTSLLYSETPLVLLDGTPVFDYDKFMEINPLLIESLEVVSSKYYYGGMSFGGIVHFTSFKNDLGNYTPGGTGNIRMYENFAYKREFFSPIYESDNQINSTIPDTRQLLYWNPDVSTDSSGKTQLEFYSSDVLGKYMGIIQGIAKDGTPGSTSFIIDVSQKKK